MLLIQVSTHSLPEEKMKLLDMKNEEKMKLLDMKNKFEYNNIRDFRS